MIVDYFLFPSRSVGTGVGRYISNVTRIIAEGKFLTLMDCFQSYLVDADIK